MKESKKEKVQKVLAEAWRKIRKVQKTDSKFNSVIAHIESAILEVEKI